MTTKLYREFIEAAELEARLVLRKGWLQKSNALPYGIKASWKRLVDASRAERRASGGGKI